MMQSLLSLFSNPFSKILKSNTHHYGAGTGHGGQFAPRDQLAVAAAQMGEHAGRGTTAPSSLRAKVNSLRATVEATHGRHISNSVYNEHFAAGKARGNAPTQAAIPTPTQPAVVPVPTPAPVPAAVAPVVVPPVAPAITQGQALRDLREKAFNHGAMAKFIALQNTAGPHPALISSMAKVQAAQQVAEATGISHSDTATHKNVHMANGISAMDTYHAHNPVTNSSMTPAEAAGAAKLYSENPTAPVATNSLNANTPTASKPTTATPAPTTAVQVILAQRYTNTSGGHNKFWTVATHGKHLVKHWGAIGTAGQKQVKEFSSPQAAKSQAQLMSAAKRMNGYQDRGASTITHDLPILNAPTPQVTPQATPIPVTPHVPEAVQGTNHPITPVQVTAPTQVPTQVPVQATQNINPNDPHGLAALDTPSKIKNAVYTAAHNYHSALKAGLPTADHADKLHAVSGHAIAKLGGHQDMMAMSEKARQDVQAGIYKLPFKARSRNQGNLPLAAQSGEATPIQTPVASPAPSPLPQAAQPPMSEKDRITHELHKMWHQRGRNMVDYDRTNIQTQSMKDVRAEAEKHETKLHQLGVSQSIINAQREVHLNNGKAERKEEIKKEDKAKTLLQNAATDYGTAQTYGAGFGKDPVSQATLDAHKAALDKNLAKAAEIIGNDKAIAMKEEFLQHGMKEGTKKLQDEAKDALVNAANKYGHDLGYNGGFGNPALPQSHHDANKAAMMAIHEKAKLILSPETLKSITTQQVQTANNEGAAQHKAEREQAAKVVKEQVIAHAHAKGILAARGKSPTAANRALHQETLTKLSSIVGAEAAQKTHDDAYDAGHAEGQQKLKDNLTKASFAMGYHAGKGTTPTEAEKTSADEAHAMVKQHIGADHADTISKSAYDAGKADALSPSMTPERVKDSMKELGLESKCTGDFAKHWAKQMPKISPKEFMAAFFGESGATKANMGKMDALAFNSSGTGLVMRGKDGILLHGSRVDSQITREFNFSDSTQTVGGHSIPPHTVEHAFLKIYDSDQGKGGVKKMFQALMSKGADGKCAYEKMGMNAAHVYGALDGGGYTWPSFGFHYDNSSRQQKHQEEILNNYNRLIQGSSYSTGVKEPENFEKVKAFVEEKNVALPNADGTKTVRPFTLEDHANYLKEHNAVMKNLTDSGDLSSGYKLTKMNTPLLNAVHSGRIKSDVGDDKRPTLAKLLMRGSSMHGTITFGNDNPQITAIRANLNKA